MASRRIENNWGSADSFLNAVPYSNTAIPSDAVSKAAPRDQKEFAKLLVDSMHQCFADSALYIKETESRVVDVVMGRIASLLDEVKATFLADELQLIKEQIIASLNSSDVDASDKQEISDELKTLFSNVTTKEELNDLKDWLQNAEYNSDSEEQLVESETDESIEDVTEDETSGEYKDSTIALNFTTLQNFIQSQVDQINENLKNIPGQSGLLSMAGTLGSIASGVASVSKLIGSKAILGITKTIAGISAGVGVAIAGVGLAVKGVKSIGSGIKKGFGAIGRGIATPFKKVGSMFSALNPFKRRDNARNEKNEAKKQALRDKVMNLIGKIIDKMWKYIEPFIDKVGIFMSLVTKTVVIPIALIALKVALIVAAIVAIGIGLYLAYNWVKKKIGEFIDYVFSGHLWEDIKSGLSSMWEWAKDFGGYLWNKLVDFGKWLLIDMPLALLKLLFVQFPIWIWNQLTRFGIWIWDKLCEFGNWLYDTYIDPYIIQPLTKLIQPIANLWVEKIQPKIQPFIDSLLKLKDMIVGIFKGWDTSKSFWENLKNMTKLIKEGVLQWWEESPFKAFYEQRIEPFIVSACELFLKLKDLGGTIKKAILDWWNGDSSLGETLTNIGTTIKNAVVEWWETSVFKQAYDEHIAPLIEKLKNYLGDLIKPIREWYETSWLKATIDKISECVQLYVAAPLAAVKQKLLSFLVSLADMTINLPTGIRTEKYMGLPIPVGFKWTPFKPLSSIKNQLSEEDVASAQANAGKSLSELINEEMAKTRKNIEDKSNVKVEPEVKPPDSKHSHEIVMQNIGAAAEPIKSIDNMKTQNNTELQRTSEAVATEVEADKRKDAVYKDNTHAMLQNLANGLDALHGDVNKYGKDPSAIPVPVPVGPTRNSAMMGEN